MTARGGPTVCAPGRMGGVRLQPYEDPRLAGVYEQGNEMPSASLRAWAELISAFSPVARPAIVDVGVGTGMIAAELARVASPKITLGVDPSVAMLRQARRCNGHSGVEYVAGDAAALPVQSNQFDLALISRVIHHLADRRRCAVELRRVLRAGGVVVVRTTVREHLDALVYQYWPRLRELDCHRFPALGDIVADFAAAGFITSVVDSFAQPVQADLAGYHDALRLRPQSKFDQLTEGEFATGLAELARDASMQTTPREVSERYDVLVFTCR